MNYEILKAAGDSFCKTKDEFCAKTSSSDFDTIIENVDLPIVKLL